MRQGVISRTKGSVLAEAVSSIALILPLAILSILFALEVSHAFVIARGLTEGARIASRALAREYQTNEQIVSDGSRQDTIFSTIRIKNLIHDNSQFKIENWNTSTEPLTVTVRATYLPGIGTPKLEAFPRSGLLLSGGLISRLQNQDSNNNAMWNSFQISQVVTYRLKY